MAKNNHRSVHFADDTGVPSRIFGSTATSSCTSYSGERSHPAKCHARRNRETFVERCHSVSFTEQRAICFAPIFSSQKDWGFSAGDKSSSVEQIYNSQALQDGELAERDSVGAQGRLHGHNRFKRCLFFDSNSPVSSKISSFQLEEPAVPVCCSSFWPYQCSKSIHESFETGHSKYATKGNSVSNLYRRPNYCGIFKDGMQRAGRVCSSVVNRSRFQCKYGKIKLNAENSSGIPRFVLDSIRMELFLPEKKKENILQRIRNLLMSRQILVRQVSSMVGLMQSAKWAVMPAVIYYRFLQRDLNSALEETGRDYDSLIMLSQEARQELKMWLTNLEMWHGRAMVMSRPSLIIQTDASLLGWGAVCLNTGKEANGLWSREETMLHINVLELMTAWFAIQTLVNVTTRAHVRFQMDNTTAVSYINKQGGTKSCQMVIIAKKIWDWAIKHQVQVSAEHLPGKQNVTADKLSRELNDNLEWSLDREVFCKLIRKAGFRPQVDLFATRLNAQVQKFVSWKPDPQAWKVDAFAITWTGIKAYAFPPFCLISRLLQKVHIENMSEMLLIAPVWKTQPWFPTLLSMLVRRPILLPQKSRFASASAFQRGTSSSDHETSRLAVVSQHLSDKGISDEAAELILASWRTGTEQQYSGAWRQWVSWCDKRKSNPLSASIGTVSQFLTSLYASGLSYSTVNTYRSAISMTHLPIDGVPVGSHFLIKRLMKGIFNKRPPVPRYVTSWPVEKVLRYLKIMPGYDQISLKLLTWKTAILIALVSADRGDAIAALSTEYMIKDSEGYHFLVSKPTKCTRPGRGIKQIDLPKFTKDRRICVVYCLDKYLRATKRLRVDKQLFISYVKPHRSVTRTSIARWIKLIMQKSGIDVSIFQPHSTRSASTSTAFQQGVSVPDILKKADWSNASVFHRFYNRPKVHADFAQAILSVK